MKIDLIARCGSRIYNLEEEKSDYDYLNLVSSSDVSRYEKGICYNNPRIDNIIPESDIFRIRTDSFYEFESCAGALMIHLYDQTCGGDSMILRNFWKMHCKELAEISLRISYLSTLQEVNYDIEYERTQKFRICARMLGLMYCRYYTNHIFEARKLSTEWKSRYWRAKENKVDVLEVKAWVEEVSTPSIREFYLNQSDNILLHDEYKKVLDKVLADSPIT